MRFADPAHDFPTHIVHRRLGRDSLLAVVSGGDTSRAQRFAFARVACHADRDLTRAVGLRDALQATRDSLRALGRAPGLSAAVALPDGRTITVTSGLADSTGRVPLTPTHRLLAGSTGKTFFAALALQLVADGRLDLDAPVARWLGDTPWFAQLPNGADITVRQLMNHTSGLVRYEFDPAFARDLAADPLRTWRVDEQLAYVLGKPAPFAAGTSWEYSDTNYLVLALVLERILGGEAYDAIRTRFLQPLRLRGVTAAGLGTGARYGLGVIIRDSPLGPVHGHSGFFPGYLTELRHYADTGLGVGVMANTSDGRAIGRGLGAIAHRLAEVATAHLAAP